MQADCMKLNLFQLFKGGRLEKDDNSHFFFKACKCLKMEYLDSYSRSQDDNMPLPLERTPAPAGFRSSGSIVEVL